MGLPVLAGDTSTPFTFPSSPPVTAPATMLVGTVKTLIGGKSVMTVGAAQTSLGTIVSSSLFTTKTLIEGTPVHLSGSLCTTSAGWFNGTLIGTVPNVLVN